MTLDEIKKWHDEYKQLNHSFVKRQTPEKISGIVGQLLEILNERDEILVECTLSNNKLEVENEELKKENEENDKELEVIYEYFSDQPVDMEEVLEPYRNDT